MSFPSYPNYKPSGVEWLGDVPEGWEVKRARAVGVFSSSGIDKKSVEGEQAVQMFNYLDVYKSPAKTLRYSDDLMWTTAAASKVVEHSVSTGDILLTPSSETADDIGHAARVESVPPNIVFSYHLLRFKKRESHDAAFLTYCFNAAPVRSYFESVCTGTTRKVLVRDDFKNAPFAIPPLAEQTAIAEFLDRETGKIDELVAEQRRLMELLKEKRQAVISHAVTQGLNPHAPMKPSGIEWLGDVPKHWAVVCAKRVASIFVPQRNKPELNTDGDGVFWVTMEQMRSEEVEATNLWVSETAAKVAGTRVLKAGAVIASCVGTFGLATINTADVIINQQLQAFIPHNRIEARFLRHCVISAGNYFDQIGTAATITYVNQAGFENLPLAVPPLEEQRAIVAFLETELAKFDTLTAEAQRAIDLLQERRTALISAAVTGQIDVRNPSPKT